MKKFKKAMLLVLCAVLLVAGSVMGTLAYLKAQTGVVKNTFTVGNVAITLDEAKVDEYGVPVVGADRVAPAVDANGDVIPANTYKLIPGHTYTKDPKVTVTAGSEECWVFVKLVNGLGTDAAFNVDSTKWDVISTNGNVTIYAHKTTLAAGAWVNLFTTFTFSKTADPASYKNASIDVTAYAVQADGFTTAEAAWAAAKTDWNF